MPDDRKTLISCALSGKGFRPLVCIGEGDGAAVMSPGDARAMAEALTRAAAQAEAESLLMQWLSGVPGMDEAKRSAALSDLRRIAARQLHETIVDAEKRRRKADTNS